MKISGVYAIKNTVTLRYRIGSSKDIFKRFSNYKAKLRNGTSNAKMQEDMANYGLESFDFLILEECNMADLLTKEKYYLELYSDVASYNKNRVINTKKKIRRGKESKNFKADRSVITAGTHNGNNVKLTPKDVYLIRELLTTGIKQKDIAAQFNVSNTLIYNIKIGKRWASLKPVTIDVITGFGLNTLTSI